MVVIVDGNQLTKLQVAGLGGGLAGNTLHGASVTEEGVGVVVEQLEAGLVEAGGVVSLGHGETDGIGEALSEGTGGDFDTGGVVLRSVSI